MDAEGRAMMEPTVRPAVRKAKVNIAHIQKELTARWRMNATPTECPFGGIRQVRRRLGRLESPLSPPKTDLIHYLV